MPMRAGVSAEAGFAVAAGGDAGGLPLGLAR
jgi:hypothetical protein